MLLPLLFAQDCPDLLSKTQDLESEVLSLRIQLSTFTSDPSLILQDLNSNQLKLDHLIKSFQKTSSISTAEEIKQVLQLISIDLSLLEDPSLSSTTDAIKSLSSSIYRVRLFSENKEFSKVYNKLLIKVKNQQEQINSIEKEKSSMLVQIEESKTDLLACKLSLKSEKEIRKIAQDQLDNEQENRAEQIDIIENSLTEAEQVSRNKQMKNFKGIQDSQNELIRNLQMQNSQLTLKLEQAQTDFAALNNAVALDKSSCETVSSELQTRSAQVAKCESNFEEFRRKVKIENLDQLQVLKDSEARLQGEIENMQDEREKLFKGVDECSKRLSEVEIEDSIKENVVKGLKNDLEYCQSSIDSAKFARTQEIEILKQDGMGLKNSIAELQKQYDENLEKMLKQSNTINELQAKIEDYEYISRRNLRG